MRPLIVWAAVALLPTAAALSGAAQAKELPKTVDAAVARLRRDSLDPKALEWMLRNPRDTVVGDLYSDFGMGMRNEFGLWKGNKELLASCGTTDPEGCSVVILQALWRKIREEADATEVRGLDCQFQIAESLKVLYKGFRSMRIGEVVDELRRQVDAQLPAIAATLPAGCSAKLALKVSGSPDLRCWVRAENSEDGRDPVSLTRFFQWFGWRNAFTLRHRPPDLEMVFEQQCTWPKIPTWFNS